MYFFNSFENDVNVWKMCCKHKVFYRWRNENGGNVVFMGMGERGLNAFSANATFDNFDNVTPVLTNAC